MIRLGLTQRVEAVPDRDERRDCLDQAWARLLLSHGYLPVPLPNDASDAPAFIDGLGLAGVILTGGNDLAQLPGATNTAPERDRFENRLLEACAARELPVLGVCRGLQMLVSFAGGHVGPLANHVATRHRIDVRPDPPIPLRARDDVNSFHGFGVSPDGIGRDLEAVAFAPDGSVEAVAHRKLPHWGIMWHPERQPHDEDDAELFRALFGSGDP
jgi:gamma-glutamyl-gamma-aminobutyrate hydrolase PuuD